jgi:transposase, IS5 family
MQVPDALPEDPGEMFADSAYRGAHFGDVIQAKGGTPRIVATAMWGRDEQETQSGLDAWNAPIHRVRVTYASTVGSWRARAHVVSCHRGLTGGGVSASKHP